TITWETEEKISTYIYFGEDDSEMEKISVSKKLTQHHCVYLTGLKPNTRYYYKVHGFPDTYYFETAPDPNSNKKIRFLVYGDNRYDNNRLVGPFDGSHHEEMVNAILKNIKDSDGNYDCDFIINVGDVVLEGGNEKHWMMFHKEIEPLAAYMPYMISFGNHEYYGGDNQNTKNDLAHAREYWTYNDSSGDEVNYWFAVGNCIFIVYVTGEYGTVPPKVANWVKNVLKNRSNNYDWIFTISHHPFYNHGEANGNLTTMLIDILYNYSADVHLSGHVHTYQRFIDKKHDWTHVITAGGGAAMDSPIESPDNDVVSFKYHYMIWEIDGNKATATAYYENGQILDEFELKK
ncbi:MAG: purple acid phosphatase family protein, partial [Promethearchaeota archaeon]